MDNCRLCSETKDVEELIEVKDSLIRLKTGIASFSEIIANCFSISKTDHVSLICFDCKEQIVNFYNFKQKVKPNLNTVHADDKILDHVRDFLNENTEQMIVIQDNQDNSLKILGAARFEQETRYSHETEEVKVEDMTAEFTNEGKEVTDDSYQPETSSNIKHLPKINQTLTRFNHSNLQTLKRKHDGRAISSFSQIRKS